MTVQRQLPREDRQLTEGTAERAAGPASAVHANKGRWRAWVTSPPPRRALLAGATAAVVGGVAMRSWAASPLWLDEAQTVVIASLPVEQLLAALREDGSPPLYYLLLHFWMLAFGESNMAVRGLSALASVATIPLLWGLARRLSGSRPVAWAAVVLLATSPFAIRYATETRMYALIVLLTVLGGISLLALRRPGPLPVIGWGCVAGAVALTHYWTFFLLGVVGGALAWLALRRRGQEMGRIGGKGLLGLALAGLLFLPWLPSFLHQLAHTGAPWASPAWFTSVGGAVDTWSGGGLPGQLLGFMFWGLAMVGFAGRIERERLSIGGPVRSIAIVLAGLAFVPIIVGVGVGHLMGTAYADRYASVGFVAFILLVALGVGVLPTLVRHQVAGIAAALGLLSAVTAITWDRTQAAEVAEVISAKGSPGDVVVVCPDQLGPALRRLLPGERFRHVAYPTLDDTARVDWTDYADRNAAADPEDFAQRVHRLAGGHAVWYVYADGYKTLRHDCSQLRGELQQRRGDSRTFVHDKTSVLENESLVRFTPPA